MRLQITGGRVIDPANGRDGICDVFLAQGHVQALGNRPDGFEPQRVIDARGRIVCPGLIDLSARLREPGYEHKGTIASETRAAASAGITTLICPPDTKPIIDTPAVVELIHQRAEQSGLAHVKCLGALTLGLAGEQLTEMQALQRIGCVGVGNALVPVRDTEVLRRAFQYAATCEMTVHLHPEEPWLVRLGNAHEGPVSTRLGLSAVPASAETIGLLRALLLAEETGVRLHVCRLSTAQSVRLIAEARQRGVQVTADVCAHQLHLIDMDVGYYNSFCHVRPPLRSRRDCDALRDGLAQGVINAVCSDHQPHERDAKTAPFGATEPGISALETMLPLMLHLVTSKVLSMQQALAALTTKPAEVLWPTAEGRPGQLAVGSMADICIFDPDTEWTFSTDQLLSAGKNSPFGGWNLQGKVTHTLLAGRVVYEQRLH
jgi:dihydroorotase